MLQILVNYFVFDEVADHCSAQIGSYRNGLLSLGLCRGGLYIQCLRIKIYMSQNDTFSQQYSVGTK